VEGVFCEVGLPLYGILRGFTNWCSAILRDEVLYPTIQHRCYSARMFDATRWRTTTMSIPRFSGIATTGISHQVGRRRHVVAPALHFLALIHPSAWKKKENSPKFTVASASPGASAHTLVRHGTPPSASKRGDLVALVTPLCSKELRLVTLQLPEKSCPIEPGRSRQRTRPPARTLAAHRAPPTPGYEDRRPRVRLPETREAMI